MTVALLLAVGSENNQVSKFQEGIWSQAIILSGTELASEVYTYIQRLKPYFGQRRKKYHEILFFVV